MTFVSDKEQRLVKLFDTKMPMVGVASRRTFVIGAGRKVLEVIEGMEAIDPSPSIQACSLRPPKPPSADGDANSKSVDAGSNSQNPEGGADTEKTSGLPFNRDK
jgi:hypothetical protein